MNKYIYKKGVAVTVLLCLIGAAFLPHCYAGNKNETTLPQPHWNENGVSYNPGQSLYPFKIFLRDTPLTGLIESPPEYGPTHGVLFCYKTGHWHEVVSDVVSALTQNQSCDEIAYVVVSSQYEMNSAINRFTSDGANLSKVEFFIQPTDAIWIRDYGPHFIWQNAALSLVDSNYYYQRSLDDFIPTLVGDHHLLMPTYDMGLHYQGGNFQPGPNRTGFATSLVLSENPVSQGFNETYIAELYQTFQGIDDLHIMPQLPTGVDLTGHIDMWMNIIDDDTVIISEFIPGSDPTAITITENAVVYMQNLGFTVYRTPAWNANHPDTNYWTHWTYTNFFRVNNRIFVPTYGENYPDYEDEDAAALAAFQAAVDSSIEIVEIDCYPIIWAAGAIHCIVMQVPRFTSPEPAVHLISPNGGEFLTSGTTYTIEWVATDTHNQALSRIDLYYSVDDGATYEFIASTNDTGFYEWTVPEVETQQAKVKVVAIASDSDETETESIDVFEIGTAFQIIYDFSAGAGIDHHCYGDQTSSWYLIDGQQKPVTTELSSTDYEKLAFSDATGGDYDSNRYQSSTPSGSYESTHVFEFSITVNPENILDLEILWEGYGDDCTQVELYIWDHVEEQWGDISHRYNQNRYLDCWAGNYDGFLKQHIRSDLHRYLSSEGVLTLLLYDETFGQKTFHDYIGITAAVTNMPPEAPVITGEQQGNAGDEYTYTFISDDPGDDEVFYWIDWGDDSPAVEWDGPYPSGQIVEINHVFEEKGDYIIRAKAKDVLGAESTWGTLSVTMPKSTNVLSMVLEFLENHPLLYKLLQFFIQQVELFIQ